MGLITAKPMLYVANVDDSQASDLACGKKVRGQGERRGGGVKVREVGQCFCACGV